MPRWAKEIVGLFLLPLCVAVFRALHGVIGAAGDATNVWVPIASGAGCWIVIFLFLPKQTWLYVLGHELTHVVWSWAFGGKLKKFRVGTQGGSVVVTKSNFFVALAPYFFPLYAVLVVIVFGTVNYFWPAPKATPVFHLMLGAAYAFHVTWTAAILKTEQSDITGQGYFFSAVVIAMGNLIILILGIALLSGQPPLMDVLKDFGDYTTHSYQWVWEKLRLLIG